VFLSVYYSINLLSTLIIMKQLFKMQKHFWYDMNIMDITFDNFPSYKWDSTEVDRINTAMYMEVKIYWTYIMFMFTDINNNCDLWINQELHNFRNLKSAIKYLKKYIPFYWK